MLHRHVMTIRAKCQAKYFYMIENLLQSYITPRFLTDARYREGHLRVINALPQRKVLGLHSPQMKAVAKELSRQDGEGWIRKFELAGSDNENIRLCYEEMVIWGYLINMEKCSYEQKFQMLRKYVPVMDNWAVCDSYCAHAKWMKKIPSGKLLEFLKEWAQSNREFEVRFAIVAAMCYLLDTALDEVFQIIDNLDYKKIKSEYKTTSKKPQTAQEGTVLGAEPYYVRMGVAWLLASALAKYPDSTRQFISRSSLPQDIIKLYIRKARESFRTRNINAV